MNHNIVDGLILHITLDFWDNLFTILHIVLQ